MPVTPPEEECTWHPEPSRRKDRSNPTSTSAQAFKSLVGALSTAPVSLTRQQPPQKAPLYRCAGVGVPLLTLCGCENQLGAWRSEDLEGDWDTSRPNPHLCPLQLGFSLDVQSP